MTEKIREILSDISVITHTHTLTENVNFRDKKNSSDASCVQLPYKEVRDRE